MAFSHSPDTLAHMITVAEQAGATGFAHLLRAVQTSRVAALLAISPGCSGGDWKRFTRTAAAAPAIAVIGDDDYCNRGPAAYPMAPRAIRWARFVMLHAAAAERTHYEAAIFAAQLTGRALIIECGTATADAWADEIRRVPHPPRTIVLLPHDGAHPVTPARGNVH